LDSVYVKITFEVNNEEKVIVMKGLQLNELTVEQKIGQVMVARGNWYDDKEFLYELLEKRAIGGIQVPFTETVLEDIEELKRHADYPVLICADMEKGFPKSPYQIPSMLGLGITGDEELAYQVGVVTAIEAKRYGFNTVWGPVVDLITGNAMCKVPRVFGKDPEYVSKMAAAVLRGYRDNGMVASAKHWPGSLDVKRDGHVFGNTSQMTEEEIVNIVFRPYQYLMEKEGLGAVMSGHTMYPNVDDTYPSSVSEKIIGILRKQGFDGLMFTDSFAMNGILQRFGEEACYGLAIKAGNDMILPNYRTSLKTSYEYLLNAYKEGVFTEERLNEAVRRVIEAQNFTLKPAVASEVSEEQKECFRRIEQDSICAIKDEGLSLDLRNGKAKLFIVVEDNYYKDDDGVEYEISDPSGINRQNLAQVKESILKRFPDSKIEVVSQYPSPRQVQKACIASTYSEEVIYLTFVSSTSYRIGENFTEVLLNLMSSMEGKISAIAHLGNPYALEMTPHIPRKLMSVGGGASTIDRFIGIMAGEYEPKGILPLDIRFQ